MTEEQVKAALVGARFENRRIAMLPSNRGPNVSQSVTKPHIGVVTFADGLQTNIPWASSVDEVYDQAKAKFGPTLEKLAA